MANLKSQEIKNSYHLVLTRNNANEIEDGDGNKYLDKNDLSIELKGDGWIPPPPNFRTVTEPHRLVGRGAQMIRIGQKIYCHERQTVDGLNSDRFAAFNLSTYEWEPLANSLTQLTSQGAIGTNDDQTKILFVNCNGGPTQQTHIYDIATNTWSYGAQMPGTLMQQGQAINPETGQMQNCVGGFGGMCGLMPLHENKLYYGGGWESSCQPDKSIVYDWDTDTWSFTSDMPDYSDKGFRSQVYEEDNKHYFLHVQAEQSLLFSGTGEPQTANVWRYCIEDDLWEEVVINPLPNDFIGEGGHFVPVFLNESETKFGVLIADTGTGKDAFCIYDKNINNWSTYKINSFTGMPLNQCSVVVLENYVRGKFRIFKFMIASNGRDCDGYKLLTCTFYND